MAVGWGKFYEHGVEARSCGKRGKGHLSSFVNLYVEYVEFQQV